MPGLRFAAEGSAQGLRHRAHMLRNGQVLGTVLLARAALQALRCPAGLPGQALIGGPDLPALLRRAPELVEHAEIGGNGDVLRTMLQTVAAAGAAHRCGGLYHADRLLQTCQILPGKAVRDAKIVLHLRRGAHAAEIHLHLGQRPYELQRPPGTAPVGVPGSQKGLRLPGQGGPAKKPGPGPPDRRRPGARRRPGRPRPRGGPCGGWAQSSIHLAMYLFSRYSGL